MKAVGYQIASIQAETSLADINLPKPKANGQDLLVEVKAVSVNPVDTKIRKNANAPTGEYKVLGWDAVGTVVETGNQVTSFKTADRV